MLDQLFERPCPICKQKSSHVFAESTYNPAELDGFAFASRKLPEYMHLRLLNCNPCSILYASPALKPEALNTLYRDADFDSSVESTFAARSYARTLAPWLKGNKKNTAVDVGAGDGSFLMELKALGFKKMEGLEPSSKPIMLANKSIRPFLKQAVFEKDIYRKNSLSLITCFQTLEHISEPFEFAEAAFEMLEPGGGVMIVAHNKDALSAKILGKKSPIFDIEHLQLFSEKGLKKTLSLAGFTDIKVTHLFNSYPLQYWTKLFPLPRAVKSLALKFLSVTGIGKIPISMKAGNIAAFGVKPR